MNYVLCAPYSPELGYTVDVERSSYFTEQMGVHECIRRSAGITLYLTVFDTAGNHSIGQMK